jgi:Electron transfer DM13
MLEKLVRNKLFWVAGVAAAALSVYLAVAVFGVQALLYDREINEDFTASAATPEKQVSHSQTPAEQASETSTAAPARVSFGDFHGVSHPGTGSAAVYRQDDGTYVLRLKNLDIFNGPDLCIYAVAADDANDNDTVLEAGFLNLGQLKGNQGNQTYELPADFDPSTYRSISVWCQRFSVNFATAPLDRN